LTVSILNIIVIIYNNNTKNNHNFNKYIDCIHMTIIIIIIIIGDLFIMF